MTDFARGIQVVTLYGQYNWGLVFNTV